MTDPQTSTTSSDQASRERQIAVLLAPYSPSKPEADRIRLDEAS
jgi:hypothetical protein